MFITIKKVTPILAFFLAISFTPVHARIVANNGHERYEKLKFFFSTANDLNYMTGEDMQKTLPAECITDSGLRFIEEFNIKTLKVSRCLPPSALFDDKLDTLCEDSQYNVSMSDNTRYQIISSKILDHKGTYHLLFLITNRRLPFQDQHPIYCHGQISIDEIGG